MAPEPLDEPPGYVRGVPRVAAVSEMLVETGRVGGEFGGVQPAKPDRAGGPQSLHHRGRVGRNPVAPNLRAGGAYLSLAIENVLMGQGHAPERPARPAFLKFPVELSGFLERLLGLDGDEAVDLWLPLLDTGEAGPGHLDRGYVLPSDQLCELGQAQFWERTHARLMTRPSSPWDPGL